ncbi:LysE family translocator [Cyanobacteria bacterium FACHB-471]|nr:LysE family translocator [Cyanobacteria bacterium FACHB-471]
MNHTRIQQRPRSLTQGKAIGLVSMLGVCAGYLVHTCFAMMGLSAILQASEVLFNIVRLSGAAYLLYLGIQMWLSKPQKQPVQKAQSKQGKLFWTGLITSVTNPKGILFFLAFLPQFVVSHANHVPLQMLVLGLIFTLLCAIVYGLVALLAGTVGDNLSGTPRFSQLMQRVTGSVLILLGVRLVALEHR